MLSTSLSLEVPKYFTMLGWFRLFSSFISTSSALIFYLRYHPWLGPYLVVHRAGLQNRHLLHSQHEPINVVKRLEYRPEAPVPNASRLLDAIKNVKKRTLLLNGLEVEALFSPFLVELLLVVDQLLSRKIIVFVVAIEGRCWVFFSLLCICFFLLLLLLFNRRRSLLRGYSRRKFLLSLLKLFLFHLFLSVFFDIFKFFVRLFN